MLRLQVFDEVRVRKEADIDRFPFFIGREVGNELVLTDPSISKKHARIENRGEAGLVLIDLNSTNGLWKENEKVDELILTPGLHFRLGKVLMGIEEVSDHSEKTVSIDRTYLSRLDHIRPEEEPRTWSERIRLNISFIFLFILSGRVAANFDLHPSTWPETLLSCATTWAVLGMLTIFLSLVCRIQTRTYQFYPIHRIILWCFLLISPLQGLLQARYWIHSYHVHTYLPLVIFSLLGFYPATKMAELFFRKTHGRSLIISTALLILAFDGLVVAKSWVEGRKFALARPATPQIFYPVSEPKTTSWTKLEHDVNKLAQGADQEGEANIKKRK